MPKTFFQHSCRQAKRGGRPLSCRQVFVAMMVITAFTIFSLFSAAQVHAVVKPSPIVPDPSLAPSPSTNQETATTDALKMRIENVMKNRGDQVKGIIDEMTLKKRGFIGEVDRITQKAITVKNQKGSETLTITSDVQLTKDGKKISSDDIAVGDWVIVMGYADKQGFLLRRLSFSSTSLFPLTYDTTLGTLQSVTKTQLIIMPRNSQNPVTYVLNKTTQYQDNQGNTITRDVLDTDSQYLVISTTTKDGKIVKLIRALGGGTTSAAPSPSPLPSKSKKTSTSGTTSSPAVKASPSPAGTP